MAKTAEQAYQKSFSQTKLKADFGSAFGSEMRRSADPVLNYANFVDIPTCRYKCFANGPGRNNHARSDKICQNYVKLDLRRGKVAFIQNIVQMPYQSAPGEQGRDGRQDEGLLGVRV